MNSLRPQLRQLLIALGVAVISIGPPTPALAQSETAAARPESDRLTAEQKRDLNLMLGLLKDDKLELPRRRDAAASLIARGWPAALDALALELRQSGDSTTQRAIASAIVEAETPPAALVKPLLELIGHDEQALRRDVAAALGRYENGGVAESLIKLALDEQADPKVRLGATQALAEHRQRQTVDALLDLAKVDRPRALRDAAFASLTQLTGITTYGKDRSAWAAWWQANRNLPRDRWLARLVQSLSNQNNQLTEQQQALERRLTESLNRLYVATPEDQRSAMLGELLNDEAPAVRLLGLRLVERKVLNAQPISDEVRQVLRRHLRDSSAEVRATAALRLRDLDDSAGMDIALERLLAEDQPAVQNAYLALLSRAVRREAIEPALLLLARPQNQQAAAELLIAADDAELLTGPSRQQTLAEARRALAEAPTPAPIRLLGRLAQAQDHDAIAALLDHELPEVRAAAADCFLGEHLPLAPLLEKIDDPTLSARVINAAGKRGNTYDQATTLIKHTPADKDARPSWRSAITAIAGRLSAADLVKLDAALADHDQLRVIRPDVLKRAAEIEGDPAARATLVLSLARLHLDAGNHAAALGLYDSLNPANLDADQRSAHRLGRFESLMAAGEHDKAISLAETALEAEPDRAPAIAKQLMDAAERSLKQQQTEQAAALIGHTQRLLGQSLTPAQRTRLDQLRGKLPTPAES